VNAIIFNNFRHVLSRQECIDELKSLYLSRLFSFSALKRNYGKIESRCLDRHRWRIMDLCFWVRRQAKSNESYLSPVSSLKLVMWRLFRLSNVGR